MAFGRRPIMDPATHSGPAYESHHNNGHLGPCLKLGRRSRRPMRFAAWRRELPYYIITLLTVKLPPGITVNDLNACQAGGLLDSTTSCSTDEFPDIVEKFSLILPDTTR